MHGGCRGNRRLSEPGVCQVRAHQPSRSYGPLMRAVCCRKARKQGISSPPRGRFSVTFCDEATREGILIVAVHRQAEWTKSELPDTAPACVHDEGSRRLVLSGLNHTTFDLTVYAAQGGSPHHHARLASGCWSSFARRDSYPQGFNERFQSSSLFLVSKAYLTQGHHTHLLCFFQGTELRDSVRFGERSPRLDAVGVSVIPAPPAPLVANAEPLERSKSGGSGAKSIRMRHRFKALTLPQLKHVGFSVQRMVFAVEIARFGAILKREADHRDRTPLALSQFGCRHQAVASGEGSAHNLTPLVPTDGGVGREAGEQWPGEGDGGAPTLTGCQEVRSPSARSADWWAGWG